MIEVVKFRAEHLLTLEAQEEQVKELESATIDQALEMEESGGYSVIKDGKTIACAVIIPLADNRGSISAFFGKHAGPHMLKIYRIARFMLETTDHRRIESVVLTDFPAGHRFMNMLGFKLETPEGMKNFGPNGENYSLYARLK